MRFRCDLDSIYGLSAVATVYAAVATVYAAVATVYAAVMTISRLWFRCGFGVVEAHLNRTETGMKPDLNHTAPPSGRDWGQIEPDHPPRPSWEGRWGRLGGG